MEEEYTLDIAKRYTAYRPPLHQLILEKCINWNEQFNVGLDIGSGTGQSAIALSKYCSKVFGVEPSPDMIKMAIAHPKIEYFNYDGRNLFFPDQSFDIITFAGSLFYAKSQKLLDEVIRVCMDFSTIIVYDFEVLIDDLYSKLNMVQQINETNYDHAIDFSGLKNDKLNKLTYFKDKITFRITSSNLAHLLLSSKGLFRAFAEKCSTINPFTLLVENLENLSNDEPHELSAKIYYTKYQLRTLQNKK